MKCTWLSFPESSLGSILDLQHIWISIGGKITNPARYEVGVFIAGPIEP